MNYKLPSTTGFASIVKNLDASIRNSGTEIELSSRNITRKKFEWRSSFNLSILRNKLIGYPGLALSSDKNNYVIGQPLSINQVYRYTGIDPLTGLYTFTDANADNVINSNDLTAVSFSGQHYFGGLSNDFRYKQFSMSVFFQFVKQDGRNYISQLPAVPGMISNQPDYVLHHWEKPSDAASIQKYTSTATAAATAYYNYQLSDAAITNASFSRIKNLSFSYNVTDKLVKRLHISGLRIYLQGQNLVTFTNYKGADPEMQSLTALPLLKVYTAGIQLTF